MRKDESEYEIDKQKRKQRLVRNEFLYNGESVGKYDIPLIRKQEIDVEKIQLLCYADARNDDEKNKDKTIHFFTYKGEKRSCFARKICNRSMPTMNNTNYGLAPRF